MIRCSAAVACVLTSGALIACAASAAAQHDYPNIAKHLVQPEFRNSLISLGLDPNVSTPSQYADALKAAMAWNIDTIVMLKKKGVKFDF